MDNEKKIINKLEKKYSNIKKNYAEILLKYFHRLREIQIKVTKLSPTELCEGQWTLLGIIQISYEFMICCIEQLVNANRKGHAACARGLIETIGSILWIKEKKDRTPSLVRFNGPATGKLLNCAYKDYKELREIYYEYSEIVHPSRTAHLLSPKICKDRFAWNFDLIITEYQAEEHIKNLIKLGQIINNELTTILKRNADIVKIGKVMAKIEK